LAPAAIHDGASRTMAAQTRGVGLQILRDWAMDFMSDRLFDERPLRVLTIVDCCTREAVIVRSARRSAAATGLS